jgi:hypothetical protein
VTEIKPLHLQLSVNWAEERKMRALARLGADGLLAALLVIGMECHCKRNLTDGMVPAEEPEIIMWPLPPEHVQTLLNHLVSAVVIAEKPDGFLLLDYVAKYGTRAEAEQRLEQRREAGRLGGRPKGGRRDKRGERPGQNHEVSHGKPDGFTAETMPETERPARAPAHRAIARDRETPPPYPPADSAPSALNGGRGGGDLITQAQALMAVQGYPVDHDQAAEIVRAIIVGRTDIAHPAAYLASRISNTEQARALAPGSSAPAGPPPPKAHPRTDRLIADAFEDRLGAVISSGQAATVREHFAGQGVTDPAEMISLIESAPDPRALLPARRHVPGRTVAQALGVGGVRIPATEEQRHKHADDARAGLESRRAELQQHTEPEQLAEQLAEPEPPF